MAKHFRYVDQNTRDFIDINDFSLFEKHKKICNDNNKDFLLFAPGDNRISDKYPYYACVDKNHANISKIDNYYFACNNNNNEKPYIYYVFNNGVKETKYGCKSDHDLKSGLYVDYIDGTYKQGNDLNNIKNTKYKQIKTKCGNGYSLDDKHFKQKYIDKIGTVTKCCKMNEILETINDEIYCCGENEPIKYITDEKNELKYNCKKCPVDKYMKSIKVDKNTNKHKFDKINKCCNKNDYILKNFTGNYKCCNNDTTKGNWIDYNNVMAYDCRKCYNDKHKITHIDINNNTIYKCCDNKSDTILNNHGKYKCCPFNYIKGYWATNYGTYNYDCKQCKNGTFMTSFSDKNNIEVYGCCKNGKHLRKINGKYVCANKGKWIENNSTDDTWFFCDEDNGYKIMKNKKNYQKCCKENEYLCSDNNCKLIDKNYIDNDTLICYDKDLYYYDDIFGYKSKNKYIKDNNILKNVDNYININGKIYLRDNILKNNLPKNEYLIFIGNNKITKKIYDVINEISLNIKK